MSKRKLLLADDSETVQKVVNLTFELEGIEVITFGDGDSAMQQLSAVAPDVVLADVNMPGISGYEICQKIKENEATRQTPVILLVGSFEPFDEEKAMQVGADDYLTKPFQSIRQLVSKVNELLSPKVTTFDETLKMEQNPYAESEYGDPGMDDEMIETSRAEHPSFGDASTYENPPVFRDEAPDDSGTRPQTPQDWQDMHPSGQTTAEEEQTVYELAEEQAGGQEIEMFEDYASDDVEIQTSDRQDYSDAGFEGEGERPSATQNEDFGVQPDDIDHFYREPDYEEEQSEETQEVSDRVETSDTEEQETAAAVDAEEPGYAEETFDRGAESVPTVEEAPILTESETLPAENRETTGYAETAEYPEAAEYAATENEGADTSAQTFPVMNFDELDLLEIPYPETLTPVSTETEPAAGDTKAEPASRSQTAESETVEVKDEVSRQLSGISLSPEDIDAIADRVVEKLTARLKE